MPLILPTTEPAPPPPISTNTSPAHRMATVLGILAGDDYIGKAVQPTQNTDPISPVAAPVVSAQPITDDQLINAQAPVPIHKVSIQPDSHTPAAFGGDNLHSGSWAHDLLSMLNLPITFENIKAMTAWQKAEGGGSDGPSHSNFNWLNTTRSMPGSTTINKVGVRSFASYHDGLVATAGALTNGLYGNILDALKAGNNAHAVAQAVESGPWGTGGGVLRVLGSA